MKKVFLTVATTFAVCVLVFVGYNLVNGGQTAFSGQISLRNETPIINPAPPPNTSPKIAIPYKEGYDPVTGRPFAEQESKPQEPITYGTAPVQESYPKMNEDYPFTAKLPAGAEGKIRVVYNYVVECSQLYSAKIEVTNLSSTQAIGAFYYNKFLKDSAGNIIHKTLDVGHHNAPPIFPLQPGDSTVLSPSNTSVKPGFSDKTTPETWKVEIEVTYVSFVPCSKE